METPKYQDGGAERQRAAKGGRRRQRRGKAQADPRARRKGPPPARPPASAPPRRHKAHGAGAAAAAAPQSARVSGRPSGRRPPLPFPSRPRWLPAGGGKGPAGRPGGEGCALRPRFPQGSLFVSLLADEMGSGGKRRKK